MTHVAFNPGRVAGADVGWMESVVPGVEEIAWALEAAEPRFHMGRCRQAACKLAAAGARWATTWKRGLGWACRECRDAWLIR